MELSNEIILGLINNNQTAIKEMGKDNKSLAGRLDLAEKSIANMKNNMVNKKGEKKND